MGVAAELPDWQRTGAKTAWGEIVQPCDGLIGRMERTEARVLWGPNTHVLIGWQSSLAGRRTLRSAP